MFSNIPHYYFLKPSKLNYECIIIIIVVVVLFLLVTLVIALVLLLGYCLKKKHDFNKKHCNVLWVYMN